MTVPFADEKNLHFRSGLSILPAQVTAIEYRLKVLLGSIPAKMVFMVDSSGQFVTAVGETHGIDLDGLGSLIAGDLAASQEIARMTGEFQDFQMILREGQRSHIFIAEAGEQLIFLVQFSKDVPLGWARKLIQKTAAGILEVLEQPVEQNKEFSDPLANDGLTDLFNDALDDIWKG